MALLPPMRLMAALSIIALLSHSALADDKAGITVYTPPPAAPNPDGVHEGYLILSGNPEPLAILPGRPQPVAPVAPSVEVVPQMRNILLYLNPKKVKAAYLGVYIASTDATLQSQLSLPDGVGLVVSGLDDSGPAKKAGLHEHDVIYKIGDQIAINPAQFEVLVRLHKPGEAVELTVYRQSQPIKITITLTEKELPALTSSPDAINSSAPNATLSIPPYANFTPVAPADTATNVFRGPGAR